MSNWHKPSSRTSRAKQLTSYGSGIQLTLSELLACKQFADSLTLPVQQKVKTHLLGGFISHFKGRGMDFDEARLYQVGDDIRSIDWRVTARTGEAHTKLYQEERERPVFAVLDQSSSMMFGTRQCFKAVKAAELASTIMWRTLNDGNRFGALLFDQNHHYEHKPSSNRKQCLRVLNKIVGNHNQQIQSIYQNNRSQTAPTVQMATTLKRVRHVARPGSLIFIISDFFQFDDSAEHHLLRLSQHNEIHLLQIYDPVEKHPPPPGVYTITDGKNRTQLNTKNRTFCESYSNSFSDHQNRLVRLCHKHRMKYFNISTADNLLQSLMKPYAQTEELQ